MQAYAATPSVYAGGCEVVHLENNNHDHTTNTVEGELTRGRYKLNVIE